MSGVVYAPLAENANKAAVYSQAATDASYFFYSVTPSLKGTTAESAVTYGKVSVFLEA